MTSLPFETWLENVSVEQLREERQRYLDKADEFRTRAEAIDRILAVKSALPQRSPSRPGALTNEKITELLRETERPGLKDATLKVMHTEPAASWNAENLLAALESQGWAPHGKTPKNSVAATLSRLLAMGEVERVGHGAYRLAAHKRPQDSPSDATERESLQLAVEEGG
jgi:hypothetical protein